MKKSCDTCSVPKDTGCSQYTAEDCGTNMKLWKKKNMKKIRLIVTLDCDKDCKYCCNKYQRFKDMMQPITFEGLQEYDEIIITGGEPLLSKYIQKTLDLIRKIKSEYPEKIIYLYTTKWGISDQFMQILELVDGIHFTLHAPLRHEDKRGFERFNRTLRFLKRTGKLKGSYRVYIDPGISEEISFFPQLFVRVESKPWLMEHEVPFNEDVLCILEDF